MPSINLDLDYFDHPKTVALVDLLGVDADVIPIRLWCYCGRFHTATGCVLGSTAVGMLERRIGWRGPAGECIKALIETGFLEEVPGGFQVHDWFEHSGHLAAFNERAKAAAKARWEKAKAARPPPDATSNATSNALSNAPTSITSSALPAQLSASLPLGREWVFYLSRKKNRAKADDPGDAQDVFDELIRVHGLNEDALRVEIRRQDRDRTEYLWQFKDRILSNKNGNGKPKTEYQELRERVEARKKAAKDG